jgi:hypothetical protein
MMHCFTGDLGFSTYQHLAFHTADTTNKWGTLWWVLSVESTRHKLCTICLRKLDNKNMSFLYKNFHYTRNSGGREGNNFVAGDLKTHSDFCIDFYIIYCHVMLYFINA